MAKAIVTLTTDFGLADHYVGTMKGVILGICPHAQIVDISHEVAPFGISDGAYLIAQAYRFFPKETVHIVVVDPGVGSKRRPIVMEAAGQFFVAPDNGVLSMIYSREKHKVRVIANDRYFLKPVSRTFHGRDIFSPVAAHLAAGVRTSRIGKRIEDYVRPPFVKPVRSGAKSLKGSVLRIDRFGNVITNFRGSDIRKQVDGKFTLALGSRRVAILAQSYAERPQGELFVIEGSGGYLEISLNRGSAAQLIGCQAGSPVELVIRSR